MNLPEPGWKIYQGPLQGLWRRHASTYCDAFSGSHSELVEKIERIDGVSKMLAEAQVKSFEDAFAASEIDD